MSRWLVDRVCICVRACVCVWLCGRVIGCLHDVCASVHLSVGVCDSTFSVGVCVGVCVCLCVGVVVVGVVCVYVADHMYG